jgi:hypothetical protein
MPNGTTFEIWVRKGDEGGPFHVKDEKVISVYGEMCAIAKELVDKGEVDEAVVLERRVVQRFRKYVGEG